MSQLARQPKLNKARACTPAECSGRNAWPNTSVEARPNGKAPGRRGALAYHAPHRPGTSPSAPPHLER